jgi:hypothetical protein
MSVTIIAYTIIGSKVDRQDFFIWTERGVHDDCICGDGEFCSGCGQHMSETEGRFAPVPGFEPEEGSSSQGRIGGLDILPVDSGAFPASIDHFLVVESHQVEPEFDAVSKVFFSVDLDAARERVRSVLEPLDLWVPSSFGIWTALAYN